MPQARLCRRPVGLQRWTVARKREVVLRLFNVPRATSVAGPGDSSHRAAPSKWRENADRWDRTRSSNARASAVTRSRNLDRRHAAGGCKYLATMLLEAGSRSMAKTETCGPLGRRGVERSLGLAGKISSPGGSIRRCRGCSSSLAFEGAQQSDPQHLRCGRRHPALPGSRRAVTSSSAAPAFACERQEEAPSGLGPGRRTRPSGCCATWSGVWA